MYVIVTCKFEKDKKKKQLRKLEVATRVFPLSVQSMWIFLDAQGQLTPRSRRSDLAELRLPASFDACPGCLQT